MQLPSVFSSTSAQGSGWGSWAGPQPSVWNTAVMSELWRNCPGEGLIMSCADSITESMSNCGRLCLDVSPRGGEGRIDVCSEVGCRIILVCAFFSEKSLWPCLGSQSGLMTTAP